MCSFKTPKSLATGKKQIKKNRTRETGLEVLQRDWQSKKGKDSKKKAKKNLKTCK